MFLSSGVKNRQFNLFMRNSSNQRKRHLDQMEEAEYEDLSDKKK